jgi:hypothetical protein
MIPCSNKHARHKLILIRAVHTAVWAFFAGCILVLSVSGWQHHFGQAALLAACVLAECLVLAVNRGQCPLTALAARQTDARAPNFDIYLPSWLARWNKTIFGTLFVIGGLYVLWEWIH